MSYGKLNEQGQLISANTQLDDSFQELSLFEVKDEDDNGTGEYYDFYNEDLTPDLDKIQEAKDLKQALEAKKLRQELLKTITVTTEAGNTFDGDDTARADMLSAIQASETLGQDTAMWKLSDNTWAEIDLDEMREASALAIQAKGKILSGDSDV